ncbi:competence protein ComFA [Ligilactobacillus salitolerans]|uniref:Competence protein ComFA n=1 Tax=Ligilactobacillus salitolerans TaxID=1808352 RepID=A0A401IW25_9LACO|nr:DEAD/DEAH box helicase family protein [Ligilactobacillus salitolerans]GBG95753.1 competence protein ComFA [Ligilactobacillus salitolerans]
MELADLYGRVLLEEEIPADLRVLLKDAAYPAMVEQGNYIKCQRCLSKIPKHEVILPNGGYYCPECILLGRVTSTAQLYHLPEPNSFPPMQHSPLSWQGSLAPWQEESSAQMKKAVDRPGEYLLWAVTGAGKTEMLFAALEKALLQGKRICLASPRVDVCNELYPRICAAFTGCLPVLLHGHSSLPYHYSQLTICTTHQLLRFKEAFDVLVIDEVDAFPFANNQILEQAAQRARKKQSTMVYLTATPSAQLLKRVKQHQLAVSYLPLRFHQHLLPLPRVFLQGSWEKKITGGILPRKVGRLLRAWSQEKLPFLVFVPQIKLLQPTLQAVAAVVGPKYQGTTVFSADPARIDKVQALRSHQLNYLVTTTILERGVTFPRLNVMVLGADQPTFSAAALVQIAGRVGRDQERPNGDVVFICSDPAKNVKMALHQINEMNYKGMKLLNG